MTESTPPTPAARAARRKRTPLVIVNTGNGKGKTTAALGTLMRAVAHGFKVVMLQFIKTTEDPRFGIYGEIQSAAKLGFEILPLGNGFTWDTNNPEQDRQTARQAWEVCKEKLLSPEYDIVALDEITYAFTFGWLTTDEVIETIRNRPAHMHVILTGRDAPPDIVEMADLVTEMREVKHPFTTRRVVAQVGIEF
ncbi:MAG: cob(I)yrinic acid a,c-diamide adenosyltransferase [Chloracidobacterium sp.]|uniref:corrinoid adenosyltransferase n=1 Tax=Chloracidobacterium validum TaxID=2821543 RepID=A0ABX8BCU7_9BACT|nr:cob(I)yrinic acid a,c-diamide adenosyltransferase [Chloracidobacterium validum]QUW04516.1 cob(I)yrinic acid a,c-diamide adenosyltransferase [Chloracidobacterium validum]